MGKLIIGSFMFIAGLFFLFTGIGAIIGIPLFAGGLAMGAAGMASMTKTAVVTGVKAGKAVHEIKKASDQRAAERAEVEAETKALADARARLEAEKRALLEAGGDPLAVDLGRPTPAS